jgi:hypothetical protein
MMQTVSPSWVVARLDWWRQSRSLDAAFGPQSSSGMCIRRRRRGSTQTGRTRSDITGHGLRPLRHIDATSYFDARMLAFKGIHYQGKVVDEWTEPGWTGSRGDIVRALTAPIIDHYQDHVESNSAAELPHSTCTPES